MTLLEAPPPSPPSHFSNLSASILTGIPSSSYREINHFDSLVWHYFFCLMNLAVCCVEASLSSLHINMQTFFQADLNHTQNKLGWIKYYSALSLSLPLLKQFGRHRVGLKRMLSWLNTSFITRRPSVDYEWNAERRQSYLMLFGALFLWKWWVLFERWQQKRPLMQMILREHLNTLSSFRPIIGFSLFYKEYILQCVLQCCDDIFNMHVYITNSYRVVIVAMLPLETYFWLKQKYELQSSVP